MTRRDWNPYERIMLRIAHYEPDYSLVRFVRDSTPFKLPRVLFWLQWSLYAAGLEALALICCAITDQHPATLTLYLLPIAILLAHKIERVASYPPPRPLQHQPDPLDWLCDVGAWGSAGALLTLELLGGRGVHHGLYVGCVVLFVLTFAFSSP